MSAVDLTTRDLRMLMLALNVADIALGESGPGAYRLTITEWRRIEDLRERLRDVLAQRLDGGDQ